MKNQWNKRVLASLYVLTVWGCTVPDPEPSPYQEGAYIMNAGDALGKNSSISFLPRNATTISADIFNAATGQPLSGRVQDYTEIDGKGVIVVDNSAVGQDKIEIVESGTFKSLGAIQSPDVENPRYVVMAGPNKAYVTCQDITGNSPGLYPNPGYVLVLDLASRTVIKKILVAKGADRMVVVGSEVFVGSAGGERVLTVIDTEKDEVRQPGVDVSVNTNPIAVDANGRLWSYASSANEMVRINTATKAVDVRLKVGNPGKTPGTITISQDRQTFYFLNSSYAPTGMYRESGELYSFKITDTNIPATAPVIRRQFSGLGVDPQTGIIYAGVTPLGTQAGYVLRFQPGGALIDSVRAGIVPSKFYFR